MRALTGRHTGRVLFRSLKVLLLAVVVYSTLKCKCLHWQMNSPVPPCPHKEHLTTPLLGCTTVLLLKGAINAMQRAFCWQWQLLLGCGSSQNTWMSENGGWLPCSLTAAAGWRQQVLSKPPLKALALQLSSPHWTALGRSGSTGTTTHGASWWAVSWLQLPGTGCATALYRRCAMRVPSASRFMQYLMRQAAGDGAAPLHNAFSLRSALAHFPLLADCAVHLRRLVQPALSGPRIPCRSSLAA